jgi:hypothetical protein
MTSSRSSAIVFNWGGASPSSESELETRVCCKDKFNVRILAQTKDENKYTSEGRKKNKNK